MALLFTARKFNLTQFCIVSVCSLQILCAQANAAAKSDLLNSATNASQRQLKETYHGEVSLPENIENKALPMGERWKSFMSWAKSQREVMVFAKLAEDHNDWLVRNGALVVTQSRSFSKGRDLALILLNDKALIVRMAAVEVLKESIEDQEIRSQLWSALSAKRNFHKGYSLPIRSLIVEVLGSHLPSVEQKKFAALAKEKDQEIRRVAAATLDRVQMTQQ